MRDRRLGKPECAGTVVELVARALQKAPLATAGRHHAHSFLIVDIRERFKDEECLNHAQVKVVGFAGLYDAEALTAVTQDHILRTPVRANSLSDDKIIRQKLHSPVEQ